MDFLARDGKEIPEEGNAVVFALQRLVLCALTLSLGVPVALVGGVIGLPRLVLRRLTAPPRVGVAFPPVVQLSTAAALLPRPQREFDVVVFGATGFTGQLAAKYLAEHYGGNNKVKFALAGRRLAALEHIRHECLQAHPGAEIALIPGVDSNDQAALQQMTARARAVVSTAGPFQLYGTGLVRACIATQTHYGDITGEADWYAGLVEHYDAAARDAGVRIVSFCGHDSVPWDLLAFKLHQRLKEISSEEAEEMLSVHMEDEILALPSGGTIATVLETLRAGMPSTFSRTLGFSPLLLLPGSGGGSKSPFATVDASTVLPSSAGSASSLWAGPFVMAMVNAQVVSRSNALNGYGRSVRYSEARVAPGLLVLLGRYLELVAVAPLLFLPGFLQRRVLPQPGQGPSPAQLARGFLQITARAVGTKGTKVAARLYFDHDVGYVGTARLLVESGLSLALQEKDIDSSKVGVLTPASCLGDVLLGRIAGPHAATPGTEFTYL